MRLPPRKRQALRRRLDAALARLPDTISEAVILVHLENRALADAAALADCPRATLRRRAWLGIGLLCELMGRRGRALRPATLVRFLRQEAAAPAFAATAATDRGDTFVHIPLPSLFTSWRLGTDGCSHFSGPRAQSLYRPVPAVEAGGSRGPASRRDRA